MSENKTKKQLDEKDDSHEKEQSTADRQLDKSSKSTELFSVSSASYSEPKEEKAMPFFDAGEEEFLRSQGLKERAMEEEADVKPAVTARDIFGKWGDEPSFSTSYPNVKKSHRDPDEEEPADHAEEEAYRSRKHSSKKEEKIKKKEKKEKEKSRRSTSPPTTSREKEPPLFPGAFPALQHSPVRHLSASREDFELKVSSLDEMPR